MKRGMNKRGQIEVGTEDNSNVANTMQTSEDKTENTVFEGGNKKLIIFIVLGVVGLLLIVGIIVAVLMIGGNNDNTDLGKRIEFYMHSPNLIDDEIVNEVVNEECERLYHSNIIFDGYPRTIDQARHLDSYLRNPIDYTFFLAVSDNTALERVAKRQQENPRSENNSEERRIGRLKEYETLTIPVVRYYLNAGKLTTIGGEGKISGISKKLVSIMEKEKQ